jgi:8-amino-7-oxononanoate synthase
MDGDVAPLPELARAAQAARAWLIVDDAHGIGVLGNSGGGCCEHFALDADDVPVLVGTFGKAFGTFGAFVAGDADLIEYLLQKSRTYIYTTALPSAVAAATRAALRICQREAWRREKARTLSRRFRQGLRERGIASGVTRAEESLPDTTFDTPIVPVVVGEAARALEVSRALESGGFLVMAIRPPTVPPGTARLRVTFSAAHEEAQVDALVDAFAQVQNA